MPIDSFFIILAAGLAAQSSHLDRNQDQRLRLESERRELTANVENPDWMQDHGRATLARLSVERGWRQCTENEAATLAETSGRPAALLAEEALAKCGEWEKLLRLALGRGAYPYLNGHVSKDDMIAEARLESRDGALARISMWRAGSSGPVASDQTDEEEWDRSAAVPASAPPPAPAPAPEAPAEEAPATEAGEAETIVVTATRRGGCRVRLADRTLTERQLAANAERWAADKTPLRVVRPAGASYHCLAKIVWSLNKYGVTLFHFVDPSDAH